MATMSRSIIALGGQGRLGRALTKEAAKFPEVRFNALGRNAADVTDRKSVDNAIRKYDAQVVINCAAMTDVDGCERDPMSAAALNKEAVANIARACLDSNALLVHMSTDFVFDGEATRPYTEDDEPRPLSVYGSTKFGGDREIVSIRPKHLIVRTSWTFGLDGPSFVTKLLDLAKKQGKLEIVRQTGSPTYYPDLAVGILALVFIGAHGTYNVTNTGLCTRADLAREALRLSGMDSIQVTETETSPSGYIAKRPAYSALDSSAFIKKTGITLPNWQDALKSYLSVPKA